MEISFKAKYVNSVPIKTTANNSFKNAGFVKLDINSDNDMVLINRVANSYNKFPEVEGVNNYSDQIRERFNRLYNEPIRHKYENFYALTIEDVNKDGEIINMDADKILGIAWVDNNPAKEYSEIEYLQVSPATNNHATKPQYKGVGKALLNTILKIFYPKDIILFYDQDAINFYHKQGFKHLDSSLRSDCMIYRQKS